MINNPPITANSIVGFDIDKYIKGDLNDNRAPEISAPVQLNKDVIELNNNKPNKNEAEVSDGWKKFGRAFVALTAGLATFLFVKGGIKAIKK